MHVFNLLFVLVPSSTSSGQTSSSRSARLRRTAAHTTARFYLPPSISTTDPLDIDNIITTHQNKIEPFTSRGSGWNVSKIHNLSLCIGSFSPTAGSSFIPTPAEIQKKKAIINIRNHNSNDCFQYYDTRCYFNVRSKPT